MIKVIIADDHKIIVDGLVSLLENEKDIEVVGTAFNGNEVESIIRDKEIDIAILDIEMPGKTGVELAKLISTEYPRIKVLILTMYKTKEFVKKVISSGASGFILKNANGDKLLHAIHQLYAGKTYIDQEITEVMMEVLKDETSGKDKELIKLTRREKEVLALIAEGKSSVEISKLLFIAPSTIDTHRRNLIDKLGVSSSKELIIYALNNQDIFS